MDENDIIPANLRKKFDKLGIPRVHAYYELGKYTGDKKKYAALYIAQSNEALESASADREESRALDALSISRSANSIAREALRIAGHQRTITIIAATAAVIAAIAAIVANTE